jgi:hypothetical protein
MKNPIELLQEVKKLVFQEETMPAPSYSLEDGTKVLIDKLEVGGVVTLEDGAPAPVGEHTLADGSMVVLSEGGVIAHIMPKEVEEKVEIMSPEQIILGKAEDRVPKVLNPGQMKKLYEMQRVYRKYDLC